MRRYRSVPVAVLAATALLLAGCAAGADPTEAPTPDATTPTSTPSPTPVPTDVPGGPFEIGPSAGAVLAVVGVAYDDALDLLAAPAAGAPVLAGLEPLADDVVGTGNAWLTEDVGIWFEVQANGATGWVDSSSVAYLGRTTDETAAVIAELGGTPEAPTMLELGRRVVDSAAYVDEEIQSDVVVTVAPTEGDLGEVTYDVIGLADDSVWGLRLHVFGTPDEDGSSYSLKSVEQTLLCGRGVTPDSLCV